MPEFDSDPDIPTLTIKSEQDSLPPLLDDIADDDDQGTTGPRPSAGAFGVGAGAAPPSETVLRALLQAEIDRAVHTALDEALIRIRDSLDAQIPEIVARVMRNARPG